ncbi:MAG: hypothetical protein WCE21_01595 [Candidatus Babeliales bacterium]
MRIKIVLLAAMVGSTVKLSGMDNVLDALMGIDCSLHSQGKELSFDLNGIQKAENPTKEAFKKYIEVYSVIQTPFAKLNAAVEYGLNIGKEKENNYLIDKFQFFYTQDQSIDEQAVKKTFKEAVKTIKELRTDQEDCKRMIHWFIHGCIEDISGAALVFDIVNKCECEGLLKDSEEVTA